MLQKAAVKASSLLCFPALTMAVNQFAYILLVQVCSLRTERYDGFSLSVSSSFFNMMFS